MFKNSHFFVFISLVLLALSSCNSKTTEKTETTNKEAAFMPEINKDQPVLSQKDDAETSGSENPAYKSSKSGFKAIYNARFKFALEIPRDWDAKDESASGDGFQIYPGRNDLDLRVYAVTLFPENEAYNRIDKSNCREKSTFKFSDGYSGILCRDGNLLTFHRDENKKRASFYVKAPENWLNENRPLINSIAESLKFVP